MENKNLLYKLSQFPFNNFFHYLKKSNIEYINLPLTFFNQELNEIIENAPEVAFEINSSPMDENVFKTNFFLKIKLVLKCKDKQSGEEKNYHIYNLDMEFEAFTHIENIKDVPELEKKKILMVDVAYLIFPFIRHNVLITTEAMKSVPVQLNIINFEKLLEAQINNTELQKKENEEQKPANS